MPILTDSDLNPKAATDLTDDELLLAGAQRALLPLPDDFEPTAAECIAHTSDRKVAGHLTNSQVNAELKRRDLKGRKVRPW